MEFTMRSLFSHSFRPLLSARPVHTARGLSLARTAQVRCTTAVTVATGQRRSAHVATGEKGGEQAKNLKGKSQFQDFDLTGGVYIVTGGARGLGLSLASGIAEAGGIVHCLDRLEQTASDFDIARENIHPDSEGSLHYTQVDVTDVESLNSVIANVAESHGRMDGCVAAAGVQKICPALSYPVEAAREMLEINLLGVFNTACAVTRQIYRFPPPSNPNFEDRLPSPSIVLIASMSGTVANKGLITPIYNASKAGVTQLTRNLAMEWGNPQRNAAGPAADGLSMTSHGEAVSIRVNALSPGNIVTPMVEKNFEEVPELREIWARENMLGRLSRPEEFRGAVVYLLSRASSFMTGSSLVVDGGYTAW